MQPHDVGDQRLVTPLEKKKQLNFPRHALALTTWPYDSSRVTRGEIAFKKPYYSLAVSGGSHL